MNIEFNSGGNQRNGGISILGRLFITVFGLIFGGAGAFVIALGITEIIEDVRVKGWTETPARVISSNVVPAADGQTQHGFAIQYEYQFNGELRTSGQFSRKPVQDDQISAMERLALKYPAGQELTCRVNPADPTQAIVETGAVQWWISLVGLPFFAVGAGTIVLAWRRSKPTRPEGSSISQTARKSQGCGILFFGVFGLIGLVVFIFVFVVPAYQIVQARNWPAVPAVVLSSEVRSHRSDDGYTYSVEILYRYQIDGRELRSNRYQFMAGSSSGRSGKESIVRRYPAGKEITCYVNPDDPTDAVIERGFTAGMWFGLLPLIFVVIGVGGAFFTWRHGRRLATRLTEATAAGRPAARSTTTRTAVPPAATEAEQVLKPRHGPWVRLLGGIAVASFWNGITSVFVGIAVKSHLNGRPEWFLTFFIIPFVLIGLGMLGYVVYAFFGLFNPRPTLRLRPGSPRLGETLECDWAFTGATGRLKRLTIEIEGVEESQYRRGTRTYTDRSVFARLPVVDADHPGQIARSGLTAMIPGDLAPSFKAENNRILWKIKLCGEIARWPDVAEEYELNMLPAVVPASAAGETRIPDRPRTATTTPAGGGRIEVMLNHGDRPLAPGDRLQGRARWSLPTSPSTIAARLFWFTRGKGGTDAVILAEQPLGTGQTGDVPFEFVLPVDQPPSVDGVLVSLTWAVEVVIGSGDEAARAEFVVGRDGAPIKLAAIPEAKAARKPFWRRT